MKHNFKRDFPIFTNRPKLTYLDNAATTQKPKIVIDAVTNFYTKYNSSVHRGVYDLSIEATAIYEGARKKIADFINAKNPSEIIFTDSTTESINLIALGYSQKYLKKGDIVVLTEMEHHSNIIPWLRLKEKIGIQIFYLPIDRDFRLDYKTLIHANLNYKKIKIISLTHASNVLGTINPLEEIIPLLKKICVNAKIIIDAAQSIAHLPINVQKLDCDFLVFSAHKIYGPSGVGILWAEQELLEEMEPIFSGGHMIEEVTREKITFASPPAKFEAGTGRLEGVAGFGAAIDYIKSIGFKNIMRLEQELTKYGIEALNKINKIEVYGSKNSKNRLPIFAFNVPGVHPHDVAEILNRNHICVRAGHHCAQILMQTLKIKNTVRASLTLYNTTLDIDELVKGIENTKKIFHF